MASIEQAIDSYLSDLAVGQSPKTVSTYRSSLHRFTEYLETAGIAASEPADRLTVDQALHFVQWLSRKISKASLRTYIAPISRLYHYLSRERMIDLSVSDVERLSEAFKNYRKGAKRHAPRLPAEGAVSSLLEAARGIPAQRTHRLELARVRNIAILEALRVSGMRVGELVRLTCGDLNAKDMTAKVTGKGDKDRIVYFNRTAWQAVQDYLRLRDGQHSSESLPVFSRHNRQASGQVLPMTTDSVRDVFTDLSAAGHLSTHVTPHGLRHAFGTIAYEATGDLAAVQDLLGHASPETTRIYAEMSSKRLIRAHHLAFGEGVGI